MREPAYRSGAGRRATNDGTVRLAIWKRYAGDEWAAFNQLPRSIRRRLQEHAYDAWAVNTLMLWRHYRQLHRTLERAERALLRYLEYCERLERQAFAEHTAGSMANLWRTRPPASRSCAMPP